MNEDKVRFVTLEMSSLDEYSQRELNAYRNLGTLRELRLLKHREMHRRDRRERLHRMLEYLLAGAIFGASIVGMLCLIVLLA